MLEQALSANTAALVALHEIIGKLLAAQGAPLTATTTTPAAAQGFAAQVQPTAASFVQPPAATQTAAQTQATNGFGFAQQAAQPAVQQAPAGPSPEQIKAAQEAIMKLINELCAGGNPATQATCAQIIQGFKTEAGGPVTSMPEIQVKDYTELYNQLTAAIVKARGG